MLENSVQQQKNFTFWNITFALFVLGETFFAHTTTGQILMIAYAAVSLMYIFLELRIRLCGFFLCYILLAIYGKLQIHFGDVIHNQLANDLVITLLINFLVLFCVYNHIIIVGKMDKMLSLLETSVFISGLIILVREAPNLLSGRLGEASDYNSNSLAMISAFMICSIVSRRIEENAEQHKLFYDLLKAAIMLLVVVFSGTRKALLIVLIGIAILVLIRKPSKAFKYICIATIFFIAGMYLILNVPVLYNIMGYRVESMFSVFMGAEVEESSLKTRAIFIEIATDYIKDNPIWGYGLNNFRVVNTYRQTYSHNNYIELLFSVGIVGLAIYYSGMLAVLIKNVKSLKINKHALLMVVFIIATLVTDYGLVSYYDRLSLVIIIFAWANVSKKNGELEYDRFSRKGIQSLQ